MTPEYMRLVEQLTNFTIRNLTFKVKTNNLNFTIVTV